MIKISGTIQDALAKLAKYKTLNTIINSNEFLTKAQNKYPHGPELIEGKEVFDLLTALLAINLPLFCYLIQ